MKQQKIRNEKGDIEYLKTTWEKEGYSKKDIDLGIEEYDANLKRLEKELSIVNVILKAGNVTDPKVIEL